MITAFIDPGYDAAGSQSFTTPGADSFVIPNYSTSLVITLWGGGGGGGGTVNSSPQYAAQGTASTVVSLSLSAGGGNGGQDCDAFTSTNGAGGTGGSASGGDTNTSGEDGQTGYGTNRGGNAAFAGNGGAAPTGIASGNNGSAAGGGGSGSCVSVSSIAAGAGEAGAFCQKTYAQGVLTPGNSLTLFIGSGGAGRVLAGNGSGGAGARGQIDISWT